MPGRKRPYDDAVPDDVLRCSVDDLLGVFRDGLLALVPMAQRLGIEWRNDDRHRDWERLSEALFDACVRGPIEADAGLSFDELRLPRYDIDVASYRTNSAGEGVRVRRSAPKVHVQRVQLPPEPGHLQRDRHISGRELAVDHQTPGLPPPGSMHRVTNDC